MFLTVTQRFQKQTLSTTLCYEPICKAAGDIIAMKSVLDNILFPYLYMVGRDVVVDRYESHVSCNVQEIIFLSNIVCKLYCNKC